MGAKHVYNMQIKPSNKWRPAYFFPMAFPVQWRGRRVGGWGGGRRGVCSRISVCSPSFHTPIRFAICTANEGPVRIQYKCLVPIYVLPEMKLLFPKQNYNVLCPSSYTHISVWDLYISRIGLPILLHGNMWNNPRSTQIAHRYINVEIGTEAAQFSQKRNT